MRVISRIGATLLIMLFPHAAVVGAAQPAGDSINNPPSLAAMRKFYFGDGTNLPSQAVVRKFVADLPPDMQSFLIKVFSKALWSLPNLQMLSRDHPARIIIRCDSEGCAGEPAQIIRQLAANYPKQFAGQEGDPAAADIEVFIMSDDRAFNDRDRAVDTRLKANATYSRRSWPCKTAFYFDDRNRSLASLAFIDSDLPRENRILCLYVELAAAVGGFYATDLRAVVTETASKEQRSLRIRIAVSLLFQEFVAGSRATYKDAEQMLREAFSLPPN